MARHHALRDAATFTQQARIELSAEHAYRNMAIFPTDPQQPQRVLVKGKGHLHLFDLHTGQEIWHIEQEESPVDK